MSTEPSKGSTGPCSPCLRLARSSGDKGRGGAPALVAWAWAVVLAAVGPGRLAIRGPRGFPSFPSPRGALYAATRTRRSPGQVAPVVEGLAARDGGAGRRGAAPGPARADAHMSKSSRPTRLVGGKGPS